MSCVRLSPRPRVAASPCHMVTAGFFIDGEGGRGAEEVFVQTSAETDTTTTKKQPRKNDITVIDKENDKRQIFGTTMSHVCAFDLLFANRKLRER
jgi:hypothetical protein